MMNGLKRCPGSYTEAGFLSNLFIDDNRSDQSCLEICSYIYRSYTIHFRFVIILRTISLTFFLKAPHVYAISA